MKSSFTISQDRLFLVGFMGVGKTTVGRALAQKLQYQFIDLDDLIQSATGKTVAEIFAEYGEAYFRKRETEMIQSCKELEKTIVALGGGAYISPENQKIIQGLGQAIWLDCPLDVIISRINFDGSRPLARGEGELAELLSRRSSAYAQADYHIRVGDKKVEQVVDAIIRLLQ
jgi:shikimate kinase